MKKDQTTIKNSKKAMIAAGLLVLFVVLAIGIAHIIKLSKKVKDVNAMSFGEKSIEVSWSGTKNADGYAVSRSTDGTHFNEIGTTDGAKTTYTDKDVVFDEDTTYYYKVRSYQTSGEKKKYDTYSETVKLNTTEIVNDLVNAYMTDMTLEQKVAQLFVIRPESITDVETAVAAGDSTKEGIEKYPVGGFIYFAKNIEGKDQFIEMVKNTQSYMQDAANIKAFVAIDEEGGTVARISGNTEITGVEPISSMSEIGATGDTNNAYEVGKKISEYLKEFQINIDFAPVADIANLEGSIMTQRSFGTDANLVADMVAAEVKGFKEENMICTLKHFPGLGYTKSDTHLGFVKTERTKSEMESCEFIPFEAGINAGADIVMVGHVNAPELTGDDTPSSLSETVITDILRGELGFDGLVVTDALDMQGISKYYTSDQAAVKALQAGVDILLMPDDFETAYKGVLQSVESGTITEDRINESVTRILKLKAERGLL